MNKAQGNRLLAAAKEAIAEGNIELAQAWISIYWIKSYKARLTREITKFPKSIRLNGYY